MLLTLSVVLLLSTELTNFIFDFLQRYLDASFLFFYSFDLLFVCLIVSIIFWNSIEFNSIYSYMLSQIVLLLSTAWKWRHPHQRPIRGVDRARNQSCSRFLRLGSTRWLWMGSFARVRSIRRYYWIGSSSLFDLRHDTHSLVLLDFCLQPLNHRLSKLLFRIIFMYMLLVCCVCIAWEKERKKIDWLTGIIFCCGGASAAIMSFFPSIKLHIFTSTFGSPSR